MTPTKSLIEDVKALFIKDFDRQVKQIIRLSCESLADDIKVMDTDEEAYLNELKGRLIDDAYVAGWMTDAEDVFYRENENLVYMAMCELHEAERLIYRWVQNEWDAMKADGDLGAARDKQCFGKIVSFLESADWNLVKEIADSTK